MPRTFLAKHHLNPYFYYTYALFLKFVFFAILPEKLYLENASCRQIEIIEIRKIDDVELYINNDSKKQIKKYEHKSLFYFPSISINNELTDFVAIIKHKHLLQEKDIADKTVFPKASKRLLYSQQFRLNNIDVKFSFLCAVVNPFKAEFLQKVYTNNSRVGIPDIKNLL